MTAIPAPEVIRICRELFVYYTFDERERYQGKSKFFTIDDECIVDEDIEKYSQIAEIMAPFFAREIFKEFKKLLQEITSENNPNK
jgi:hypothetical protein